MPIQIQLGASRPGLLSEVTSSRTAATSSGHASGPTAEQFRSSAVFAGGHGLREAMAIDRMELTGRFGVELEMENITLTRMCEVAAEYFGPQARIIKQGVLDKAGRLWEVKPDLYPVSELATPPLSGAADLRLLLGLAERLTRAGATVSDGTGVHVHVDAKGLSEKQLVRLLALVAHHESDLVEALQVDDNRLLFCGPARLSNLPALLAQVPTNRPALMQGYRGARSVKCLGLNVEHLAPSNIGTLEFRWFNGTLNPSVIGCHVGLAMAMARYAGQDGPLPAPQSVQGNGALHALLHALDLRPEDPSSIFLYRSLMKLPMPAMPEPMPQHPKPSRRDIAFFAKLDTRREAVIEILAGLPAARRTPLMAAAEGYLKAIQGSKLHAREMLALSRLAPAVQQRIIAVHGAAVATLPTVDLRAEALGWFAEHADQLDVIDAAFGEFTLPYKIAAPGAQSLPLLRQLQAMGLPLADATLTLPAFKFLAHMSAEKRDLHLAVWDRRSAGISDTQERRAALNHILECFHGCEVQEIGCVLGLLEQVGIAFDKTFVSAAVFRALAARPDSEALLRFWLVQAGIWCATPEESRRFLESMVNKSLDLAQVQMQLMASLLDPSCGWERLRTRLELANSLNGEHLRAVSDALAHAAPHVRSRRNREELFVSFAKIMPHKLRAFTKAALDLENVAQEDKVYALHMRACGIQPIFQ